MDWGRTGPAVGLASALEGVRAIRGGLRQPLAEAGPGRTRRLARPRWGRDRHDGAAPWRTWLRLHSCGRDDGQEGHLVGVDRAQGVRPDGSEPDAETRPRVPH